MPPLYLWDDELNLSGSDTWHISIYFISENDSMEIKITLNDSQQPKLSNVSPSYQMYISTLVQQVHNACQSDTVESHQIGTKWTFYDSALGTNGLILR